MTSERVFSVRAIMVVTLTCSAMALFAFPAMASSSNYVFLLASGFLCDPGDSSTCQATAKCANGDSYEMSGAGTFDSQAKTVKAAGTYSHKSPNGNVLETGVWIANEVVSFDSYGVVPNALPRLGVAFVPSAMSPKRMPISRGSMPTGGHAVFRILLVSMSGRSTIAVLQVNCALGEVPRERSLEGIRLTLERNNSDYSGEISGRVMFLSIRLEMTTPVKTPQEPEAPENSEQPHN